MFLALLLVVGPLSALAQQTPPRPFELTVDSIMRGPDLVGYPPQDVRWSRDGRKVYFRWKRAGEPRLKEFDTYVVGRDGEGLRKLTEEEARQAPPSSGDLSKDKRLTVFADEGDIYLYDHARGERRPLTRTTEAETNPRFTSDGRRVYFTRSNNLYLLALDGGSLEQLTDIRTGGAASPTSTPRGTESQESLKKEERELLEAVRERAEKREQDEARRKQRERRKPYNLAAGQGVVGLTLSPDGRYVVAAVTEPATGAKTTIVPNYVTESAFTEDIPSRVKVGDTQTRGRVVVFNAETGDAKVVDHGQRVDAAPRVRTRTESNATEQAQRERGAEPQQSAAQGQQTQTAQQAQTTQTPPRAGQQQQTTTQTEATQGQQQQRDRDVQLFAVQWSEDGKYAAMLARSTDNKDRWVLLLDPATGKTRVLFNEHDEAWTNGPGAFTLGWMPDNRRVYFQSERDGFAHLYTVAAEGGAPVQLTRGEFEVSGVRLSEDKTKFFFTSSEGSFFERHLYSMPVAGGARTRLTTMLGNNQVDVSPDERTLAVVRSYANRPPELYLQPNRPAPDQNARASDAHATNGQTAAAPDPEVRQVTTSPVPEFFTHNWVDPP
ncbi:MAG TPA: DPP IV N-terminal domain-containing protein, partial [Pyrinomonadaceae bacterium]|nr:DPP IV N-terminal domain-containing protein [Pyrinomonadaceae bacterium]